MSLGPEAAAEPIRHGDEQLVAGGVPEAVVDGLEVVEVDEQDRELRWSLGSSATARGRPVAEQGLVRQR